MSDEQIHKREILKVDENSIRDFEDMIAVEEPLEISISIPDLVPPLSTKNISITMRTPGNDKDLAVGFLFTEGIISEREQVLQVHSENNKVIVVLNASKPVDLSKIERHFYTSSSCGVCGKASIDSIKTVCQISYQKSNFKIDTDLIKDFPLRLNESQNVFKSTGGLHAAAAFNIDGKLLSVKEDVGRHNALDKLIGAALLDNKIPLEDTLLLLSGRASFELIQKASMAGIQFIMAVGAPSSLAIELASEFGITLIGFLKSNKFNIYCGKERINFDFAPSTID